MRRVLVVIPTFKERDNIGTLIDGIFALRREEIDVLVVDDNSPDGTADTVRERQKRFGENRLKLVVRTQGKAGRGSACLHGFTLALSEGYDAAMEMDSDLSHDPSVIPEFLQKAEHADVVIGSRYAPGGRVEGWPWHRKLLSKGANIYERIVLKVPISDYTNGYRYYGPRALGLVPDLEITGVGFTVIPQMSYLLFRHGCTFAEVPIIFINRRHGTSNMGWNEIYESFFAILRIRSQALEMHAKQCAKFALTGLTNATLDMGLLVLFVEVFAWPLLPSNALSAGVAITNAFLMNKCWTFRNNDPRHIRQYVQFLAVYGSSFILNMGTMWLFAQVLGVWYVLVKLVVIPLCAIWNYLWMHFGVFRRESA